MKKRVAVFAVSLALISGCRRPTDHSTVMCINNLSTVACAAVNYESEKKKLFLPYTKDAGGKPMHSWTIRLLPYIDEAEIYNQYNFDLPWDAPENLALPMPGCFRCAYDTSSENTTSFTMVSGNETVADERIVESGNYRVWIIESADDRRHWLDPSLPSIDEVRKRKVPFRSSHPDEMVHVCLENGNCETYPQSTTLKQWEILLTGSTEVWP